MSSTGAVSMGLLSLGVFWFAVAVATHFHPLQLIMGEDGIPSTSKFQFFVWTGVVVFSYVALFCVGAQAGGFAPLEPLPVNLLIAMGISATTAVGAKAIATNGAQQRAKALVAAAPNGGQAVVVIAPAEKLGGILLDDDGTPDLAKVQLVVWTLIGVGIYLTLVFQALASGHRQLPDIDRTLMVLMGLGHAAYVGKKVAAGAGVATL